MERRIYLTSIGGMSTILADCLGGDDSTENEDETAGTEEDGSSDETTGTEEDGSSDETTGIEEDGSSDETASTSDPEPSSVNVGEQHTIGNLAITVEEIAVDDERSNSNEETHAILLHLTARNLSETRTDGPSPNSFLLHTESEQWDWSNFATFDSGEILPERQSSGWIGYRIPQSISAEDLSASYLTGEAVYRWQQ